MGLPVDDDFMEVFVSVSQGGRLGVTPDIMAEAKNIEELLELYGMPGIDIYISTPGDPSFYTTIPGGAEGGGNVKVYLWMDGIGHYVALVDEDESESLAARPVIAEAAIELTLDDFEEYARSLQDEKYAAQMSFDESYAAQVLHDYQMQDANALIAQMVVA